VINGLTFDGATKDPMQQAVRGFFADPAYGVWKVIGYPGARYDYRGWVERHNERYPLPPVSIGGRPCCASPSDA
jgi:hypothetical protein